MARPDDRSALTNFRKFFVRGLGILLPSVLTIWILVAAYNFVSERIAEPINRGVRHLVLTTTPWPPPAHDIAILVDPRKVQGATEEMRKAWRTEWNAWLKDEEKQVWADTGENAAGLCQISRKRNLENWWDAYSFPLDLIGLLVACFLIYLIGGLVGSFLGARVLRYFEGLLRRVPGIKQVYPYVKQVTDFLVGDSKEKLKFNKVVAVEYPRKGIWSVGLVTGETMRTIQDQAQQRCVTVFVPSSPTPFTGYVITIPEQETIELGVSIEEALRFAVSGGVIVPPSQQISDGDAAPFAQLTADRDVSAS